MCAESLSGLANNIFRIGEYSTTVFIDFKFFFCQNQNSQKLLSEEHHYLVRENLFFEVSSKISREKQFFFLHRYATGTSKSIFLHTFFGRIFHTEDLCDWIPKNGLKTADFGRKKSFFKKDFEKLKILTLCIMCAGSLCGSQTRFSAYHKSHR